MGSSERIDTILNRTERKDIHSPELLRGMSLHRMYTELKQAPG